MYSLLIHINNGILHHKFMFSLLTMSSKSVFMDRRAIPVFHGFELYIYIYMFVSLVRVFVVYVVKEVTSFQEPRSINGRGA